MPATVDMLSRVHIGAGNRGITTDSGSVPVDDAVVDLGTSGSVGLMAANLKRLHGGEGDRRQPRDDRRLCPGLEGRLGLRRKPDRVPGVHHRAPQLHRAGACAGSPGHVWSTSCSTRSAWCTADHCAFALDEQGPWEEHAVSIEG
jgi:hypothetical protein